MFTFFSKNNTLQRHFQISLKVKQYIWYYDIMIWWEYNILKKFSQIYAYLLLSLKYVWLCFISEFMVPDFTYRFYGYRFRYSNDQWVVLQILLPVPTGTISLNCTVQLQYICTMSPKRTVRYRDVRKYSLCQQNWQMEEHHYFLWKKRIGLGTFTVP